MIKKEDILLIAVLLLGGLWLWWQTIFSSGNGDTVVISVSGKESGSYSLGENREIPLTQGDWKNVVSIRDGTVRMEEANCAGQECVRQGEISKSGESIICLPHQIVVEITAGHSSYDAIVS